MSSVCQGGRSSARNWTSIERSRRFVDQRKRCRRACVRAPSSVTEIYRSSFYKHIEYLNHYSHISLFIYSLCSYLFLVVLFPFSRTSFFQDLLFHTTWFFQDLQLHTPPQTTDHRRKKTHDINPCGKRTRRRLTSLAFRPCWSECWIPGGDCWSLLVQDPALHSWAGCVANKESRWATLYFSLSLLLLVSRSLLFWEARGAIRCIPRAWPRNRCAAFLVKLLLGYALDAITLLLHLTFSKNAEVFGCWWRRDDKRCPQMLGWSNNRDEYSVHR